MSGISGVRVPTTIQNPVVYFISFEAADQAASILTDWLKGAEDSTDARVYACVQEVRNGLQALMNETDVIMLEDN